MKRNKTMTLLCLWLVNFPAFIQAGQTKGGPERIAAPAARLAPAAGASGALIGAPAPISVITGAAAGTPGAAASGAAAPGAAAPGAAAPGAAAPGAAAPARASAGPAAGASVSGAASPAAQPEGATGELQRTTSELRPDGEGNAGRLDTLYLKAAGSADDTGAPSVSGAAGAPTPLAPAGSPATAAAAKAPAAPLAESAQLSRGQRFKMAFMQFLRLPKTLWEIRKMAKAEYNHAAFNENVLAFKGYHTESWDPHYRQRTWNKIPVKNITPDSVQGISLHEMATMMRVAMEIEDPILEYSHQSGEGYRFLLPTLARFMGKNKEQADYAKEHGIAWCESAWCKEEERHGNAWAVMIKKLTNAEPARDNPNDVTAVTSEESDAIHHVLSREATEWNASSTYAVMAVHAKGELRDFIQNLMRDEIKHLTIISASDVYLFGHRPWGRFWDILKVSLDFLRYHKAERSGGAEIGSNPVTMFEVAATHMISEYYVRKWLKTLPLATLTEIFETPSYLPELAAFKPAAAEQARIDGVLKRGKEKRDGLERWKSEKDRAAALEQRRLEAQYAEGLDKVVADLLDGFKGAEIPGSAREAQIRGVIDRLPLLVMRTGSKADVPTLRFLQINSRLFAGASRKDWKTLKASLVDRLLDYQIRNNRHVLGRGDVEAIKNASSVNKTLAAVFAANAKAHAEAAKAK